MIGWIIAGALLYVALGIIACYICEGDIDDTIWLYVFFWPGVIFALCMIVLGGVIVDYFKKRR